MEPHSSPWSVVVGDGSGNGYACEHAGGGTPRCRYSPVTPEQSSTGRYSGGDPWEVELAPAQVEALWREVDAAAKDVAGHTQDRAKTTLAVEAKGSTTASFILHADAGAALLAVLTALRPASAAAPSMR